MSEGFSQSPGNTFLSPRIAALQYGKHNVASKLACLAAISLIWPPLSILATGATPPQPVSRGRMPASNPARNAFLEEKLSSPNPRRRSGRNKRNWTEPSLRLTLDKLHKFKALENAMPHLCICAEKRKRAYHNAPASGDCLVSFGSPREEGRLEQK